MGMERRYIVQSYSKGDRGRLVPDAPFIARDLEHARRTAEKMVPNKPMVVALVHAGDSETGDFDDPKVIFAHGDNLPEEIEEMEKV